MDSNGLIWLCDSMNNIVRTIPLHPERWPKESLNAKDLLKIYGNPANAALVDGNRTECAFRWPLELTLVENKDSKKVEKIYLTDYLNNAVRLIDTITETVITVAGNLEPGYQDGVGKQAKFDRPAGIEINKARTMLYISEFGAHSIRTIDLTTTSYIVSTLAGVADSKSGGYADGIGSRALFSSPFSMTWFKESSGNDNEQQQEILYLTDFENHAIRKINVQTAEVGTVFKDNTPDHSMLKGPYGISVDKNGLVYVVDLLTHSIQRFTKDGSQQTTLCGSPNEEGIRDGVARNASFHKPRNLIFDPQGNILFTQRYAIRTLTGFGATSVESSGSSLALNEQPPQHQLLSSPTLSLAATQLNQADKESLNLLNNEKEIEQTLMTNNEINSVTRTKSTITSKYAATADNEQISISVPIVGESSIGLVGMKRKRSTEGESIENPNKK